MQHTLAKRLWSKVRKRGADDCWPYKRYKEEYGYGKIWHGPGLPPITVQQAVWLVTHGPIPEGYVVMTCPLMRHCCNPKHIGLGTPQDVADRILWRKGQNRKVKREKRTYQLSDQDVRDIRAAPPTTKNVDLAYDYGVSEMYISLIRRNLRRKDVTPCSPSHSQEKTSTEGTLPPSSIGMNESYEWS